MLLPAATLFLIIGISMATAQVYQQQHSEQQLISKKSKLSNSSVGGSGNVIHLLEILNPWLSACDLRTGQDFEPNQCRLYSNNDYQHPFTTSITSRCRSCDMSQCLYFQDSHISSMCDQSKSPNQRLHQIRQFRLHQCCERSLISLFSNQSLQDFLYGGSVCENSLRNFLEIDKLVSHISCEFAEILERYDCDQPYSLVFNCDDCKSAYREWVCSSLLPYFDRSQTATRGPNTMLTNSSDFRNRNVRKIRPCRSICHNVEKKCPYLLPGDRAPAHPTQYAGQSTFICRDPYIEESGEQKLRTLHGTEDCCYKECTSNHHSPYCIQCPFMDIHIEKEPKRPDCNFSIIPTSTSTRLLTNTSTNYSSTLGPFSNNIKCQIKYYERTKSSTKRIYCFSTQKYLLIILVTLLINKFV